MRSRSHSSIGAASRPRTSTASIRAAIWAASCGGVDEVMHRGEAQPLVAPEQPMSEAVLVMTETGFGCTGVRDGSGRLAGIITDGDLRRHMAPDLMERKAGEVMSASPRTVAQGTAVSEALGIMESGGISALFVVDEEQRPVGFLRLLDLLRLKAA